MKAFAKVNKSSVKFVAALACMVLAGSILVFAVPGNQIFRYLGEPVTFTGACCTSWNESVHVTEASPAVPVVVTFTTDYQASAEGQVGLSLNGGTCNLFFGSNRLPEFNLGTGGSGPFGNASYQWVIKPADGLKVGNNSIALCGGGSFGDTSTIVLGFNTLAVRLSK
jgi:hypothetical protein